VTVLHDRSEEIPDLRPREWEFAARATDESASRDWIQPWNSLRSVDAALIGLPFRGGSQWWEGTDEAPDAVRDCLSEYASLASEDDLGPGQLQVADMGDVSIHMTDTRRSQQTMESTLTQLYRRSPGFIPILIGGDHSVAAPSFRAFSSAHGERLGLIDFDAHNDLRDPAMEGQASSTPFRQLIDGGFVRGVNATQVGLHGFLSSPSLKDYGDRKGLLMISARETRARGIHDVLDSALERASARTDGIYVSLDIDVMDPAFVLGTNSPCSGGLAPTEILEAVRRLGASPLVRALDIVEVDPLKDLKGMTSRLVAMIVIHFLGGVRERLATSRASGDGKEASEHV
jgi:formiminoglutamase